MGKLIDLSGKKFGRLRVLKRAKTETGHGKHACWECRCECGAKTIVSSNALRGGNTASCGCLTCEIDLRGRRFGKWVVLEKGSLPRNSTNLKWVCLCECGNIREVVSSSLLRGSSRSCGCNNKYHNLKHGLSGTPEYNKAQLSKRKAHKLRNGGSHTPEEILKLLRKQRRKCHYCGNKLAEWHQEHKIPLSRGGTDYIENIVISCPSCNWRKRDKTEEEFYTFLSDTKRPA